MNASTKLYTIRHEYERELEGEAALQGDAVDAIVATFAPHTRQWGYFGSNELNQIQTRRSQSQNPAEERQSRWRTVPRYDFFCHVQAPQQSRRCARSKGRAQVPKSTPSHPLKHSYFDELDNRTHLLENARHSGRRGQSSPSKTAGKQPTSSASATNSSGTKGDEAPANKTTGQQATPGSSFVRWMSQWAMAPALPFRRQSLLAVRWRDWLFPGPRVATRMCGQNRIDD